MIAIALEALTFARKHWRIVAIAALLIAAGLWVRGYSNEQCERCRAQVMSEMQQRLDEANERYRTLEKQSRERVQAVASEYEIKLQDLDQKYRDAVRRIGPVRVCRDTASPADVPTSSSAASVDHGAAAGDGLPPETGGRDIGPDLIELARLADRQTQQLIACQAYAAEVSGQR